MKDPKDMTQEERAAMAESRCANIDYLIRRAKASVSITVNAHRDVYESAREWLSDWKAHNDDDIPRELEDAIISADTIVEVQVYTDTPVGFRYVLHHDLDAALSEMVRAIQADDSRRSTPPGGAK